MLEYQVPYREYNVLWYCNEISLNKFLDMNEEISLACLEECTAIFNYNDIQAQAMVVFLQKHQIRIPDDISIVSYDDSPLAGQYSLTSIAHPKTSLGRTAASNLLHLIKDPSFDANFSFLLI